MVDYPGRYLFAGLEDLVLLSKRAGGLGGGEDVREMEGGQMLWGLVFNFLFYNVKIMGRRDNIAIQLRNYDYTNWLLDY